MTDWGYTQANGENFYLQPVEFCSTTHSGLGQFVQTLCVQITSSPLSFSLSISICISLSPSPRCVLLSLGVCVSLSFSLHNNTHSTSSTGEGERLLYPSCCRSQVPLTLTSYALSVFNLPNCILCVFACVQLFCMGSGSSICSICSICPHPHLLLPSSTVSPLPGPSEWGKSFPIAVTGTRQSPIDIVPDSCNTCSSPGPNGPLKITYPASVSGCSLKNSGYGWVVNLPSALQVNANITGTALNGETYVLEQFHAHWGHNDTCGSEHTICGKSYSAELHLVHWNKDRFASFAEAAKNEKGLAVVAVFLNSCDDSNYCNNNSLATVTQQLKDIPFKGDIVDLKTDVQLSDLLPNGKLVK